MAGRLTPPLLARHHPAVHYTVHFCPGRGFSLTRDLACADNAREVFVRGHWIALPPGQSPIIAPVRNLDLLLLESGVLGRDLRLVVHL